MARPIIEPVSTETLPEFAAFLHEHLSSQRSAETWYENLRTHWSARRPNHGFVVRDDGKIVGGIGAYYADRNIGGKSVTLCNITSWCVLDKYRQQSMRLAMAVIGQPGYHFTDFSPTKVVAGALKFLKFRPLDERQAVILNLPWLNPACRLLTDPADIESALAGDARRTYLDHVKFPWLKHVLIGTPGAWCHVIYKRGRFKGFPAARVLYLSDTKVFARGFRRLSAHLLVRGMLSTHVECRFLARQFWPSAIRSGFNPKLYFSPTLTDADIDYLYSETMALDL